LRVARIHGAWIPIVAGAQEFAGLSKGVALTLEAGIVGIAGEFHKLTLAGLKHTGILGAGIAIVADLGRELARQCHWIAGVSGTQGAVITKRRIETPAIGITQIDGAGIGVVTSHILMATFTGGGIAFVHRADTSIVTMGGEHTTFEKVAAVDGADIAVDASHIRIHAVACQLVARLSGAGVVVVATLDGK
jgi:hypothetical protein